MTAVNNIPFTDSARAVIKGAKISYGTVASGEMAGQNDKGVITVAKGSSPTVIAHELFHSFFETSKIDPAKFNADFESAMKSDPRIAKFDTNLDNSHYNRSDKYSLANERFAFLGSVAGNDGLSGIPTSLQKYYSSYLKD